MHRSPYLGASSERSQSDSSTDDVDWKAYHRLLKFTPEASSPFQRNASEYGLTRLLAQPARRSSSLQLALDLFRDGKRVEQRHNVRTAIALDEQHPAPDSFFSWQFEVERAVVIVRQALLRLAHRQCQALALNAQGIFDEDTVRRILGVGLRRYRSIVAEARRVLWSQREVEAAYAVLVDEIGGEHDGIIIELIEEIVLLEEAA